MFIPIRLIASILIFLLCDPVSLQPLVALELDDKSHQRKDRQKRDAFVDGVFKAAGIALVHIPVRRAYQTKEILAHIAPYLDMSTSVMTTPTETIVERSDHQVCPKCGNEMILRTAKKGANTGNQFWGCSNYPTCRAILSYDE